VSNAKFIDTAYDELQIIENERGWLFYDAAFKNWKAINGHLVGKSILDIGCASGVAMALGKLFNPTMEFTGVEGNNSASELWRGRGLKVDIGDIFELNYAGGLFDTVYTSHVLEHLADPLQLIKEAFRVAKKRVIHSVPDGDVDQKNFGSPHLHKFNRRNFKALFSSEGSGINQFKFREIAYFNVPDVHMSSLVIVFEKRELN
jgi:ubiquinone/menaquinone biosynthesis C-methylase UbiE